MPQCAYCNQTASMTREHLIPASIGRIFSDNLKAKPKSFIPRDGGKYVDREQVIKDVCAPCNNIILGGLDEYMARSFIPQCLNYIYEGDNHELCYDYIQLSKWLIKVGFNSARANKSDDHLLKPHRQFVLGESPIPKRIAIYALAVTLTKLSPYEMTEYHKQSGELVEYMYPDLVRISQIGFPSTHLNQCVTRAYIFKSVMLVLLLGKNKMKATLFDELKNDYREYQQDAVELKSYSSSTIIKGGSTTALNCFAFHNTVYPNALKTL